VSLQTTNQSFDELAKGLATGTLSRGKALRWMGGALLGAALASVPGVAWANDCRRLGRGCRRDSQCCSGNCIRRGDDKVCGCREGQTLCKKPRGDGRCVNLKTNERHCGECFNRCPQGQECVDGVCSGGEPICDPPCPEGQVCVQEGPPGTLPLCRPVCTPSCPQTCLCFVSGDGSGNVCIAGGSDPAVSSCDQCPPTDFPEKTVCYDFSPSPDVTLLFCGEPCP
jgi:Stigma-specific protein, Stig1